MPYYIKKKAAGKKTASRTAIERLDKIFSLYIRLRDSRAFGFKAFKCISCGQVKPFRMADCGHYFSRHGMTKTIAIANVIIVIDSTPSILKATERT